MSDALESPGTPEGRHSEATSTMGVFAERASRLRGRRFAPARAGVVGVLRCGNASSAVAVRLFFVVLVKGGWMASWRERTLLASLGIEF